MFDDILQFTGAINISISSNGKPDKEDKRKGKEKVVLHQTQTATLLLTRKDMLIKRVIEADMQYWQPAWRNQEQRAKFANGNYSIYGPNHG
jgi:hypothetical protein